MLLSELKPGESAVILKVRGHGGFRKRIMEMGFVRGKRVTAILNAPLQDPVKYSIMDYEVSLRRSEAAMVEIIHEEEAEELIDQAIREGHMVDDEQAVDHIIRTHKHTIHVALVGNPNSGKTSLFNAATGFHEHVGNYGGVTVDAKRGRFKHKNYQFVIYDLPGTYSLSAYTPEEIFVREHIADHNPDVVVNVVAASNLERNLYLTTELIDMDCTAVMALNMYDELEQSGATLDYNALAGMLGMPVVPTVSRSGKGLVELFDTVIELYENRETKNRHIQITHTQELESSIEKLAAEIRKSPTLDRRFPTRYLAIKLLENDREINTILSDDDNYPQWSAMRDHERAVIEKILSEDVETAIANDKYGFITGALKETYHAGEREEISTTKIIDSFVTHKLWGFPIFFFFMWLMFECTFSLGQYPMDWIESGVAWLGDALRGWMPNGMLKDLLVDGVVGGVGGVIVFLPNILILYLFISFMEDSGYMARAAFIMDKVMHRMGLHGKSFIPLIMGFGCNVPAIMATRSIESRSSRLITILINPFMSCSARLPVYLLLVGAFFPERGGLVMFCLYLLGILFAVLTAKALRKFYFKKDETPFVMELPPYRMPTARATVIHMWEKAAQYLKKMGGIILVASVIVWFLSYYPRYQATEQEKAQVYQTYSANNPSGTISGNSDVIDIQQPDVSEEAIEEYLQQRNSYMGTLGRAIQPAMAPLGFDWKESVALLTGAAAKEVVVSTMGVLHSELDSDETSVQLKEKLRRPDPFTGEPPMTTAAALAFLVFCLLYFPCIAALIAIAKESGSWKWAAFSFFYNTAVAWIAAYAVYNIAKLFI